MRIDKSEYLQGKFNPVINILGLNTDIILANPVEHFLNASALGRWVQATNTIFINEKQHPEQQLATLYHEVTHALLEAIGELERSKDEDFVEKLSRALLQTMVLRIDCNNNHPVYNIPVSINSTADINTITSYDCKTLDYVVENIYDIIIKNLEVLSEITDYTVISVLKPDILTDYNTIYYEVESLSSADGVASREINRYELAYKYHKLLVNK